jgi:hypothetical protein
MLKGYMILSLLLHLAPPPQTPVHWLYSKECCEEKDCHPVPCDEVVDTGQGWKWKGQYFPKTKLKASPDGGCHVCSTEGAEGTWRIPHCIYLPPRV